MSITDSPRKAVVIDRGLLDAVSAEARASARRRKHYNFHSGDMALAHRLLNAIEPGSYVAPHRHLDAEKDETMIVLRGQLGIVIFADDGTVIETHRLESGGPAVSRFRMACFMRYWRWNRGLSCLRAKQALTGR